MFVNVQCTISLLTNKILSIVRAIKSGCDSGITVKPQNLIIMYFGTIKNYIVVDSILWQKFVGSSSVPVILSAHFSRHMFTSDSRQCIWNWTIIRRRVRSVQAQREDFAVFSALHRVVFGTKRESTAGPPPPKRESIASVRAFGGVSWSE